MLPGMAPLHKVTVAGPAQTLSGDALFRGLGTPAEKSVELLFVSVQPLAARKTAVVFDGAGVGPVPSKQLAAAPKPTKSTMAKVGEVGHEVPEVITVVELNNATFPAVADILIVPVTSAVGKAAPTAPPLACLMR